MNEPTINARDLCDWFKVSIAELYGLRTTAGLHFPPPVAGLLWFEADVVAWLDWLAAGAEAEAAGIDPAVVAAPTFIAPPPVAVVPAKEES